MLSNQMCIYLLTYISTSSSKTTRSKECLDPNGQRPTNCPVEDFSQPVHVLRIVQCDLSGVVVVSNIATFEYVVWREKKKNQTPKLQIHKTLSCLQMKSCAESTRPELQVGCRQKCHVPKVNCQASPTPQQHLFSSC